MIKINLLPTKAKKKKESTFVQLGVAGAVLVIACIICFFINQMIQRKLDNEQVTINDLNAKLGQLKSVIERVEGFKSKKQELESKVNAIKQLNEQRTGPVKFMAEFSEVVPERAWITTFKETDKAVTLEGIAADGPTVAQFVDNLRASKYFTNIDLLRVEQTSDKGQTRQKFYINCNVNYTVGM